MAMLRSSRGVPLQPVSSVSLAVASNYTQTLLRGLKRAGRLIFGTCNILIMAAWVVETARTTCRRYPFYGTAKCGLPGLVVHALPVRRLQTHYRIDLLMVLCVNLLYLSLCLPLSPFVMVGSLVTWWTVFRPRKFHGLLFRLNKPPVRSSEGSISLPVMKSWMRDATLCTRSCG